MKTPERSVKDIVDEFMSRFAVLAGELPEGGTKKDNEMFMALVNRDERIADWLTKALQTERQRCDEMVEAEREDFQRSKTNEAQL